MGNRFCQRARLDFFAEEDGEKLSVYRALIAGVHQASCPFCRRYQRSLQATRAALTALRDAVPKDEGKG